MAKTLMALAAALMAALIAAALCAAASAAAARAEPQITVNVAVINFDPVVPEVGKPLHEACRWNDPRWLTREFIKDIRETSGGFVRYRVALWVDANRFPPMKDGFCYTAESYYRCFKKWSGWHKPDRVDYWWIIETYGLRQLVDNGDADEIWIWCGPFTGFWESQMVGPTAYWCNSPPLRDRKVSRNFVIMFFNYERDVGCMLESFGHRVESILWHVYGRWDCKRPLDELNTWERFTLYDKIAPGMAAVGNVHFAPNSERDYDWGNKRKVWSTCDDWLHYPNLTGRRKLVDCSEWGGGDMRAHHRWWLAHLPKAPGRGPDGKLANWWKYIVDFNRYPESR